jgi:hypothetical protein
VSTLTLHGSQTPDSDMSKAEKIEMAKGKHCSRKQDEKFLFFFDMTGEMLFLVALVDQIDVATLSPGGGFSEQRGYPEG